MKKIGILTLNGNSNYGNKLQNYALEQTLIQLGFNVETLWINIEENKSMRTEVLKAGSIVKRTLINLVKDGKLVNINSIKKKKEEKFKLFSSKYLNESKHKYLNIEELSKIKDDFDYFVVGSDQVWNPYFVDYHLSSYLLDFAPKHKSISYAASFGISEIPVDFQPVYKKCLNSFKAISVRETKGVELVTNFTKSEPKLVLDPTMLLSASDWKSIFKDTKSEGNKYVLTYYLGNIPSNYLDYINNIAREQCLTIVNIANVEDKKTYCSDPAEFLELINNCELFFTDSFHGCVFSILFEKPFIVFERQGGFEMYSRIETLLTEFKLECRKFELLPEDKVFDIDYSSVLEILEKKKIESLAFIQEYIS